MKTTLPIDSYLSAIKEKLAQSSSLVLTAEPGAGKTTRLPPSLIDSVEKQIWVLEPRRVAALSAASRVADERGWQLGKEVGYQVRFDNRTQKDTRIIYMTEALLNRKILQDPELNDVGMVILDEFHERSLQVDLALSHLKTLQEIGHPLKIVVMSATLNAEKISAYLNQAPIMAIPGNLFDLKIHYQKQPQSLSTSPDFFQKMLSLIKEASAQSKRDILVFVPGKYEIERLQNELETLPQFKSFLILPLHGNLSLKDQQTALQKAEQRKIILSTNIAESSVTVDGVDTVIDSGLARVLIQEPYSGFSELQLKRISLSSARQRAGRAARQFPGTCYRLWNPQDELSFRDSEIPEIQRADLSEALLFLAALGTRDFMNYNWFEAPNTWQLERAQEFLQRIQALNPEMQLTPLGKKIADLPIPPRLGVLIIKAQDLSVPDLGFLIASILQEKDFVKAPLHDSFECDLTSRLHLVQDYHFKQSEGSLPIHSRTVQTIIQNFEKFRQSPWQKKLSLDPEIIRKILLAGFSDRLVRRRKEDPSKALMMGRRGVKIDPSSQVKKSEFALVINGQDKNSQIQSNLLCGIPKEELLNNFSQQIQLKSELYFDDEKNKFYRKDQKCLGDLPLEEGSLSLPTAEEVQTLLPSFFLDNFGELLKANEALQSWISRWDFFSQKLTEWSEKNSLPAAPGWNSDWETQIEWTLTKEKLQDALNMACYGEKSITEVQNKDLISFFENLFPTDLIKIFNLECPKALQVPSSKWMKLQYDSTKGVFMEVRLQEIFGWPLNPRILFGQIPVTLHLLGPNFRPVQVTQDLGHFWKTGYFEIKKELKARYPKHYWPDDPVNTKPRIQKK